MRKPTNGIRAAETKHTDQTNINQENYNYYYLHQRQEINIHTLQEFTSLEML